jgi:hypothetical protein
VQTSIYYDLLRLERANHEAGITVKELKDFKGKVQATMREEDIAWVEKKIAEASE